MNDAKITADWISVNADAGRLPLADRAVDLVFGSPPYEDARTYGLDFNLRGEDWVSWAATRFLECLRVCRGLVAWVVSEKTKDFRWSATSACLMADLHRQGVHLRRPPIFHRVGIAGSGGVDWLRNDYEPIICAAHGGKLPWAENTAMGHPPKWAPGGEMSHRLTDGSRRNQWGGTVTGSGPRDKNGNRQSANRPSHREHTKRRRRQGTDVMETQNYRAPAVANPGNVIACTVGGGHMGHPLAHKNEAPFPEPLAEFFVRSFCPPGGVVLDPFSGSGTTVAVAMKHGRRGIGIDIRGSQCLLTRQRMCDVQGLFA